MDASGFASRARRAARKPPRVLAVRLWDELNAELDRVRAPRRDRQLDAATLLRKTRSRTLDALWNRVRERSLFVPVEAAALERLAPGETDRVLAAAESALARRVCLLGSAETTLGTPVDWHSDFISGATWSPAYWRSISYVDPHDTSDVKVPWELSRFQWALPAAQAYVLTGDERYAAAVRELLEEWISANPYARSVNWAVTMEVALRVVCWSWLAGALGGSGAWEDSTFRLRFLRALYLHGDFTARHLERSDVNGNHYTADALGLLVAGAVLDHERWADTGWRILVDELPRQVHPDGVDFEASSAYHRLVAELFLLAALQRSKLGLPVAEDYTERLLAMARFTAAYTRPDGTAPLWGDADDARALPLGGSHPGDHRHLVGAAAAALSDLSLAARFSGSRAETAWLLGTDRAALLPVVAGDGQPAAFPEGGAFVLGRGGDHVFVDCGPVGLAGRGGHGHNDCLSFEAVLDGTPLVTDCGSYVYTASFAWRNRFRSTAFHNTPQIDGAEQNRLDPRNLWRLEDDIRPVILDWHADGEVAKLRARHHGFEVLDDPVTVERTISWHGATSSLAITDRFDAREPHRVTVPLHLAEGVDAEPVATGEWLLRAGDRTFALAFTNPAEWVMTRGEGWVSPSYGVKRPIVRLRLERDGPVKPLSVVIAPRERLDDALEVHSVP